MYNPKGLFKKLFLHGRILCSNYTPIHGKKPERQAILIFYIQNFLCLNSEISETFPEFDPESTFSPYYLPIRLKIHKERHSVPLITALFPMPSMWWGLEDLC